MLLELHVTDLCACTVMEVASGECGDQMVRLVKAVQRGEQNEQANGDTSLHPLLWQGAEEVKPRPLLPGSGQEATTLFVVHDEERLGL